MPTLPMVPLAVNLAEFIQEDQRRLLTRHPEITLDDRLSPPWLDDLNGAEVPVGCRVVRIATPRYSGVPDREVLKRATAVKDLVRCAVDQKALSMRLLQGVTLEGGPFRCEWFLHALIVVDASNNFGDPHHV